MRNARGMTFLGMLLAMSIIIIFGLLLLRIIPVYIEHYEVTHSLSTLNTLPKDSFSTDGYENRNLLKKSLLKQFEINSISDITDANITVSTDSDNKTWVTVKYQAIRPFIANISLLFNFEDSQEVTLGSE